MNANARAIERSYGLLTKMNGVCLNQIELQKDDFMDEK